MSTNREPARSACLFRRLALAEECVELNEMKYPSQENTGSRGKMKDEHESDTLGSPEWAMVGGGVAVLNDSYEAWNMTGAGCKHILLGVLVLVLALENRSQSFEEHLGIGTSRIEISYTSTLCCDEKSARYSRLPSRSRYQYDRGASAHPHSPNPEKIVHCPYCHCEKQHALNIG